MSTLGYHFPEFATSAVNVPSARDGGVTGIMIHVVMNADKEAGSRPRTRRSQVRSPNMSRRIILGD